VSTVTGIWVEIGLGVVADMTASELGQPLRPLHREGHARQDDTLYQPGAMRDNPDRENACPHVRGDVTCIASSDSLNQTHMVSGFVAAFISSTADCRGGPQIESIQNHGGC
jgi:hypothetical protein